MKVRLVSVWVLLAAAAVALGLSACGGTGGTTTVSSTGAGPTVTRDQVLRAATPSDAELEAGAGANWPSVGGDTNNSRFSTLSEIDTSNVKKLHLVWQGTYSPKLDGSALEEESNPLVLDGVMFMITPEDNVVAVDAATGEKAWEWKAEVGEEELRTEPPTGVQGLAVGDGMVFVETNAANVVGIDVKSGQTAWSEPIALGETVLESPSTPSYYKGVVYVGVSGGESGRGHVDAYEAKTGKLLWRTFLVCGAEGEPPASGKCPAGSNNPNEGGGSVWTYPAFDAKDGLLYVTTANPSADQETAGNFQWATSIVALKMKTGHIAWGFQGVHHDLWDYDCTTPPVLYEAEFEGGSGKKQAVNFTCKTDYHYALEQGSGKALLPIKEEPAPTAAGGKTPDVAAQKALKASETQPIPANSDKSEVVPRCANEELIANPAPDGSKYTYSCTFAAPGSKSFIAFGIGSGGGQDGKTPLSYDPETGSMYYCEMVSAEAEKLGEQVRGGSFLGINHGWQGSIAAVGVSDNTTKWLHKTEAPEGACRGGVSTTAGDLAFSSADHGKFMAFDAETGKELWSFQGPSDLYSAPVVFEAEGHEYVAVYYGGQVPLVGGMSNEHYARMLVFSVEGEEQPSAGEMPKTEFAKTEVEAFELAAEGKLSAEEEEAKALEGLGVGGENEESTEGEPEAGAETEEGETAPTSSAGESVFTTNCASCHTLAAAGAEGTVGPNLDTIKPSQMIVEHQVVNGGGGMPAFGKEKLLSTEEIEEVAEYVSSVAGSK